MKIAAIALLLTTAHGLVASCVAEELGDVHEWYSNSGSTSRGYFISMDSDKETVNLAIVREIKLSDLTKKSIAKAKVLSTKNRAATDLHVQRDNQIALLRDENKRLKIEIERLKSQSAQKAEPEKAAEADEQFTTLLNETGNGTKSTSNFVVNNKPVALAYAFKDTTGFGGGIFQVMVHEAGSNGMVDLAVNENGKGNSDSTTLRLSPGQYYFKVNAANCAWSLRVIEAK